MPRGRKIQARTDGETPKQAPTPRRGRPTEAKARPAQAARSAQPGGLEQEIRFTPEAPALEGARFQPFFLTKDFGVAELSSMAASALRSMEEELSMLARKRMYLVAWERIGPESGATPHADA